jgi:hypothetical protein
MADQSFLQETRANRDLFARVLLEQVHTVIEPLLQLDARVRASIIVLVGAAQLVTAYERSLNHPSDTIGEDFDAMLATLHEEGAQRLSALRTAGLAESIAYALARSRVHHDEATDLNAARAAAAELACAMSYLEGLMDLPRDLGLA